MNTTKQLIANESSVRGALLSLAVALFGLVPAFDTASASVTFIGYGTVIPDGETLVTDFSSNTPRPAPGLLYEGSTVNRSAAPAFSATTADPRPYLSLGWDQSVTFTLPLSSIVSIYVGSLDPYNKVCFGGGDGATYTGRQLGEVSGSDDGDWWAPDTNGRFIFTFSAPVDSITLSSSWWTFEVADIAAGVPEPTTWGLMLVGLAGLGAAIRRRRRLAPTPAWSVDPI
jgi:hypothetical protein